MLSTLRDEAIDGTARGGLYPPPTCVECLVSTALAYSNSTCSAWKQQNSSVLPGESEEPGKEALKQQKRPISLPRKALRYPKGRTDVGTITSRPPENTGIEARTIATCSLNFIAGMRNVQV